jgi:hypothetical protein
MVKKSGGKKTSKDLTVKDLKVKLTDVLISGY